MTERKNTGDAPDLWGYVKRHKPAIEDALQKFLPLAPASVKTQFNDALHYALFPGGKRLRPVLTMLAAEAVGGSAEAVLPPAVAVEYIHTSSLIFDDLPCMDDAGERRGKTSLHARFGEGLSVLVGLGLLNASYGLVFVGRAAEPERAMRAHAEIVECVGSAGMVGGQAVDLAAAQSAGAGGLSGGDHTTESIRNLKTSALMRLALRVGAILAGADAVHLDAFSRFSALLGDAYQLGDDLLDLEEDGEIFKDKPATFALQTDGETVRARLKSLVGEAKEILYDGLAPSAARANLAELADYLAQRKA